VALTGSSVMIALAFLVVLLVVLPGDLAQRRDHDGRA
jgi:hypothetical protein